MTFWPASAAYGGDHALEFGLEFGVVKLVAGERETGSGGGKLGLGGTQIVQRGVIVRLGRPAVLHKLAETALGALGLDEGSLCGGHVRLRRIELVLIVLDVERREDIALLDRRAHINAARDQFAVNPEREVALVARLDVADSLTVVEDGFGIHHNGTDRTDLYVRVLRLAGRKNQRKAEKNDPRPHG